MGELPRRVAVPRKVRRRGGERARASGEARSAHFPCVLRALFAGAVRMRVHRRQRAERGRRPQIRHAGHPLQGRDEPAQGPDRAGAAAEEVGWPVGYFPTMLPLMVQKLPIDIVVEWDPEASVWVGTTDDIYGFGIEDADLDRLVRRAPDILLDLFELNNLQMPEGQHD